MRLLVSKSVSGRHSVKRGERINNTPIRTSCKKEEQKEAGRGN